jgi:heme-degrading monooxygenase HmoA
MTMISRQWRGLARAGMGPSYIEHLRHETFPKLREIPGFVGASILMRTVDRGTEFLIVTRWRSMEAIQQFAGQDAEVAVVPETSGCEARPATDNLHPRERVSSFGRAAEPSGRTFAGSP